MSTHHSDMHKDSLRITKIFAFHYLYERKKKTKCPRETGPNFFALLMVNQKFQIKLINVNFPELHQTMKIMQIIQFG